MKLKHTHKYLYMWEFIDKVVYVNLAKRTDRREKMEEFVKTFGDKVIRFEAIEDKVGLIGCTKSQISVLKMAKEHGWKNVLILDDDCAWNKFEEGYAKLETLCKSEYDVIMLGGTQVSHDPDTSRLYSCKGGVAYIVQSHYYDTLISNIEEGFGLLLNIPGWDIESYSIDAYWASLQSKDKWFILQPCLVYQLPGYSNICHNGSYVDYTGLYGV